jgi:uncharacterized protein
VSNFVGRVEDFARIQDHLDVVTATGTGRLVLVRGRRQVGKSRLVSEFVSKAGVPSLFFTGSRQSDVSRDLELLRAETQRSSTLPGADLIVSARPSSWDAALRLLANVLPVDRPAIVVFDEFPWLLDSDSGLDGTLQVVWDRELERRPILMILIGSDIATMESLSTYGRPLFGRTRELVIRPFSPRDTSRMLGLQDQPAEAFDSYLVTGGYPRLTAEAARFRTIDGFITNQLKDEHSDLAVMAQRTLSAEFPSDTPASTVLRAIGSGERSFRNIGAASQLGDMAVHRALDLLATKKVVSRDQPASVPPANQPRYRVDDSYVRFWLALIEPVLSDIARGRSDLAQQRFSASWLAWRGRAIEPLVRDALARLAIDDPRLNSAGHVSGWWPRSNNPEVDLVGVDRLEQPTRVAFIGSIKWRERDPFGTNDLAVLERDAKLIPGASDATQRIAISRTGVSTPGVVPFSPDDLLQAWA